MILPKPYSRLLSTCIKIGIVGVAAVYIFIKAGKPEYRDTFVLPDVSTGFWILLFALSALNWWLEAWKWKYMAALLEPMPWGKAVQAVLAGITMGIATPNRTGEFLGRVFSLEKSRAADGFFLAAAGSFFQLMVTLLFGIIGFFMLEITAIKPYLNNHALTFFYLGSLLLVMGLLLIFLFSVRFRKRIWSWSFMLRFSDNEKLFVRMQQKKYWPVFVLSLARYIVFSSQFVLLLYAYNMDVKLITAFSAVSLTYLIVTIIPSFALTEVLVRGSAAAVIIGSYSGNERGAMLASLLLWVINIALPAVPGAFFIWRMRFFKTDSDAG